MAVIQLGPFVTYARGKLTDRVYTARKQTDFFRELPEIDYPNTPEQQEVKENLEVAVEVLEELDEWEIESERPCELIFSDIWEFITDNITSPSRSAFIGQFVRQAKESDRDAVQIQLTEGKAYARAADIQGVAVEPNYVEIELMTPIQYHRDTETPLVFTVLFPEYSFDLAGVRETMGAVYGAYIVRNPNSLYTVRVQRPSGIPQWSARMILSAFMVYVKRDLLPTPGDNEVMAGRGTLISDSQQMLVPVALPQWMEIPDQMFEVGMPVNLDLQTFVMGLQPIMIEVSGLPQGLMATNGLITGAATEEGTFPITVVGRNDFGQVSTSFTIQTEDATMAPVWSMVEVGTWSTDLESTLDLNAFVSGSPMPVITLENPRNLETGLTFSDGVISGRPTNARNAELTFRAMNSEGMADVSINLGVVSVGTLTFTVPPDIHFGINEEIYISIWPFVTNAEMITANSSGFQGIIIDNGIMTGMASNPGNLIIRFTARAAGRATAFGPIRFVWA